MKKMSSTCYAMRQIKHMLPKETLKIIYFAHTHSIMSYGLILWGNSQWANKVFLLQKKIVIIIANANIRDSCKEHFRNLQIMTLYSQHIYSIILFTVNNKQIFSNNNEIHNYNTRNRDNLHLAITNLTKYKKEPYILGIKIFNHLL